MAVPLEEHEIRRRLARIETLLQEVEQRADPRTRTQTRELVQALLDLHGAGLARILQHLKTVGEAGQRTIQTLAQDDVVASLLLLHDLHPLDTETRVMQALDKVRPSVQAQECSIELLGVVEGVVRLQLREETQGAAAVATFQKAVEEGIYASAPEIGSIEFAWTTNSGARIALPLCSSPGRPPGGR